MRPFRAVPSALALLWLALPAPAQHYAFHSYGREAGLTNLDVGSLHQDRQGFLWAGTRNGLFRYEGGGFRRFDTNDGLPSNTIHALHETPDGTLWVATQSGLARFSGGRFEKIALDWQYQMYGHDAIDSDGPDRLYFTTDRGLAVGQSAAGAWVFSRVRKGDPAAEQAACGVHATAGGRVWYGCGKQLCIYDGTRVSVIGPAGKTASGFWSAIGATQSGDVWARSYDRLYLFRGGSSQAKPERIEVAPAPYKAGKPITDHAGRLLVPTLDGLAIQVEGTQRWRYVGAAQGLANDEISAVLQDREGEVWIGMAGHGLSRWSGYGAWEIWGLAEGLASERVWELKYDGAGVLWAGTSRGMHRFVNGRWELWPRSGIPSSQGISFDFSRSPKGTGKQQSAETLWVASYPHGLFEVDARTGSVRKWDGRAGIESPWIAGVIQDREGRIWVSTHEGLFRSAGEGAGMRFLRQLPPGGGPREQFYACRMDRRGRVWAPGSQGLAVLEDERWRRFTVRDGLLRPFVRSMAEAPDGAWWVAYADGVGISRLVLEGERLAATHIQAGTQLRSNLVYSLGFDRRGWLWAGTDNGIDVSRPEGWRHYSQADGVAWNDTNLNALVAGRGGDVWIGTNRGLSRFLGSESGREHTPPNVMLTSVRFGDRAAETGSFAEVPFADRSLHISFTATTFHDEPEVRFRYRLSGLSDRWVTTAKRDLHFAGLPARRYELEIMACSARGVWSRQPARFEFRILSPWYMRWWLLASAAGILMLLTRGVHRWRLRRLLRNQSRLEAMVADRTRELSDAKIRAEESSRAKSAFLAIMSHEIRTPLNGVLGMTSLVLDGELTAEQRDNLEISKRSGESLLALLDDILDLSRIEAGRLPLNTAPFSLPDCVELAMQTLAVEARQKGLDFTSSIAADLPAWISGDRTRLRQVLINLLGNAIKFTERGYVRLEVVGESSHDGQLEVRFSVKDSGVGVPPDKLVAIFEPFRQADSSTTRRYGGSGLGLAISARLVAMMGGRIWVESLPGEGSQFCFTARCAPAAAPVESRNPVEAADGRRPLRVLLAEDNKVNQKVAFRMLQKLGHEVVTAEDGRQAVEHFRDGGFDVVLMDIQMPEVDGFDATRSIRALERAVGQRTPIIAMTAFAMPGDRERCLEAGMDGYVAKPIAMEKLKQAIREVTGQPS